jgi:hypothetical protein
VKLPPGMTESQVAEVIYRVVDTLANKFRFGFHSSEDIRQEGARFAIEALNKGSYDPSRPLENFLYTHMRNRLINYKRDNYVRNEPPCHGCIFYDPKCKKSINKCAAFDDKAECKKLTDWLTRNTSKKSLMRPMDTAVLADDLMQESSNVIENVQFSEIQTLIDKMLPVELRTDYLRMLDGIAIPKARKMRVREAILTILRERNDSA